MELLETETGSSALEDAVVLLGIDVERLLVEYVVCVCGRGRDHVEGESVVRGGDGVVGIAGVESEEVVVVVEVGVLVKVDVVERERIAEHLIDDVVHDWPQRQPKNSCPHLTVHNTASGKRRFIGNPILCAKIYTYRQSQRNTRKHRLRDHGEFRFISFLFVGLISRFQHPYTYTSPRDGQLSSAQI